MGPVGSRDGAGPEAHEDLRGKFELFSVTRDPALRAELAQAYLPLAASLAARFAGRSEPLEDLEQAANLALVKAIDRYDPARGFEFTTFAWATINGELKRHLRDRSWAMRVPRRLQEHFLLTARAVDDLHQDLGRAPTVSEVCEVTGLREEDTIQALEVRSLHRLASLDASVPGEDSSGDWEPGALDEAFDHAEDQDLLDRLLARLPDQERELLRLRFGEQLTQSQIASRIGVSQMHVSRLLTAVLDRLRAMAAHTSA